MSRDRYRAAEFVAGAHELSQLPADRGREVAFAGRSNSGKSSVLNALTGNRKLARASKTPGRTRQINFFAMDDARRLVDLPGYGYARVDAALRRHWEKTLADYVEMRESLRGIVIVMDARHAFTAADELMLELAAGCGRPAHVLLNKCDKLSNQEARNTLAAAKTRLAAGQGGVQLFSALRGTGVPELRAQLDAWLE